MEKYLIMVTSANNNKFYHMKESGNGTFHVHYGRVGAAGQHCDYPMSQWDKKYSEKVGKGYRDVTDLKIIDTGAGPESRAKGYKDIDNEVVSDFVGYLLACAQKSIRSNYSVEVSKVSAAMVQEAQNLINSLGRTATVMEFNRLLIDLYEVIPRAMPDVKSTLARGISDFEKIVSREQSVLDVMRGQVYTPTVPKDTAAKNTTILEDMGLVINQVSDEVDCNIKKHLGKLSSRYVRAFRVVNNTTQAAFDKYCAEQGIKKPKLLYHGSRNENWWNIICLGLMLRPNAKITGKMFGNGIYFANNPNKSVKYLDGGYWAGGSSSGHTFLAVYDTAYKNPYDVHVYNPSYAGFEWKDLQRVKPGAGCLHAHAGASLVNDEIVFYREDQMTVHYLIELS